MKKLLLVLPLLLASCAKHQSSLAKQEMQKGVDAMTYDLNREVAAYDNHDTVQGDFWCFQLQKDYYTMTNSEAWQITK